MGDTEGGEGTRGDLGVPRCPQEFAPSDEELEAYRRGEEWDPARAEERRRLRVGGA